MDTIRINDIRAYGYTGAFAEENVLGQWFRVDLSIALDLAPAGISDALTDTYNYAEAVKDVQQLIQQMPYQLVESLASEIAKVVLLSDDRLSEITVKLTKLTPPVPNFSGNITVEITRDRSHLNRPSPKVLS
jgi:dihydroneopterin aldolase